MNVANLFDTRTTAATEEIETLLQHETVRIERIISHGEASPDGFWYDQAGDEWVILVRGAAALQFEDECIQLKAGDHLLIPAHRRHRVERTSADALWLAVHLAGR